MPWLISMLGVSLKFFAAYAVTRVLLALGLSYVTITGFTDLKTQFMTEIQNNYGALPAAVIDIISLAGADVAITILFSCVTVRLIMNGLVNGVIGTLAFKGIQSGVS